VGISGQSQTVWDEEQRRGQTVGAAMVGGMTPWAPVDMQAVGKPGRVGQTVAAAPIGLVTWCDTRALKELAGWAGWVGIVAVGPAPVPRSQYPFLILQLLQI
jgi:hypothetical protein